MAVEALIRMANQIAANFSYEGEEQAVTDVANHIRSFWTPAMRHELGEFIDGGGSGLSEVSKLAMARVRA